MKRIILFSIFILLLIISSAHAVHYPGMSIRFKSGVGSFRMDQLHDYQNELSEVYSENGITISELWEYPEHSNFQIQLSKRLSSLYTIGIFWGHASTGSKSHLADYTGELLHETRMSVDEYGMQNEWNLKQWSGLTLNAHLQISMMVTQFQSYDKVEILSELYEMARDYSSLGIGFEPGVSLSFQHGIVVLAMNFGYQYAFNGSLQNVSHYKDLRLKNGDLIKPDWSGVRRSISIGIEL